MKTTVHSANALVGTCKMGQASDPMAVVDAALKVSRTNVERACTRRRHIVVTSMPQGRLPRSTQAMIVGSTLP